MGLESVCQEGPASQEPAWYAGDCVGFSPATVFALGQHMSLEFHPGALLPCISKLLANWQVSLDFDAARKSQ